MAKEVLRDVGIFPRKDVGPEDRAKQERMVQELDEFERGYPRLTLSLFMDVVSACHAHADRPAGEGKRGRKEKTDEASEVSLPYNTVLRTPEGLAALRTRVHSMDVPGNAISWRALLGRLGRLHRLKVFDTPRIGPLVYKDLLQPGRVSLIDLSDSGASELNNLVIADLLRGVQEAQDRAYRDYERAKTKDPKAPAPTRVLVIIEEAHEFLSVERIAKMDTLFQQVARVAKRGRKRWLGLAFVTQLPNHLPRQVLSLCNNFVLHKLTDPQVVQGLRHSISGISESLWSRLPGLAPGQAIVSFGHMAQPLLVSIDPAPSKLRMVD